MMSCLCILSIAFCARFFFQFYTYSVMCLKCGYKQNFEKKIKYGCDNENVMNIALSIHTRILAHDASQSFINRVL